MSRKNHQLMADNPANGLLSTQLMQGNECIKDKNWSLKNKLTGNKIKKATETVAFLIRSSICSLLLSYRLWYAVIELHSGNSHIL